MPIPINNPLQNSLEMSQSIDVNSLREIITTLRTGLDNISKVNYQAMNDCQKALYVLQQLMRRLLTGVSVAQILANTEERKNPVSVFSFRRMKHSLPNTLRHQSCHFWSKGKFEDDQTIPVVKHLCGCTMMRGYYFSEL